MIKFEFNATLDKPFLEVISEGEKKHSQTMIKLDATSNEAVLKTCQDWLDSFGLVDEEYKVVVRLH